MIVAFTPVPRNTPLFNVSSKSRWAFLESLNQWNIMANVAKIVVDPEKCCSNAPYVTKDQHSAAAAQLLQDLIEKVSLEDTGDLLLLPIGQNETLIYDLIEGLIDPNIDTLFRSNAAKLLSFLLRRAAESDIMYFIPTNSSSPPQPTFIPNRLFALRENIVTYIHNHFDKLANSVLEFDKYFQEFEPIKYSSYEVKKPFGALRYLIIEVIVLTVESVETAASLIPVELWKSLISLVIQYAYNNVYHALFYRLVFAVLRYIIISFSFFFLTILISGKVKKNLKRIYFKNLNLPHFWLIILYLITYLLIMLSILVNQFQKIFLTMN